MIEKARLIGVFRKPMKLMVKLSLAKEYVKRF